MAYIYIYIYIFDRIHVYVNEDGKKVHRKFLGWVSGQRRIFPFTFQALTTEGTKKHGAGFMENSTRLD